MKILYIAHRINMTDGYAVHCRAFVGHVQALGHAIVTYPEIRPIDYDAVNKKASGRKGLLDYIKKLRWRTIKRYLHKANGYVSEGLSCFDGLLETFKTRERIGRLIDDHHIDVVIYRQNLFNFAPFMAAKKRNIPIVCEVNSMRSMEYKLIDPKAKATVLTRWAERKSAASADAVCVVSTAIKQKLDAYGTGVPVSVVVNGVDADEFNPERHPRAEAKKKLDLSDRLVLGYVGSYKNWHGLDVTVEVLDRLRQNDPRWHLLLIGNGSCFADIERTIRAKGLARAVTQIKAVPHQRVPEYMAAFDIALMTYPALPDFYFSPLKMFEYMAMGIPVVATKIGQIAEIVSEDTGVLVDPPTAENFSAAIEQSAPHLERLGVNARRLMVDSYSWAANASHIMEVCEQAKRQTLQN